MGKEKSKPLDNGNSTKPCRNCRNQILEKASICTKCSCYQNWRRFIPLSESALSLILAIISVSTVFATVSSGGCKYSAVKVDVINTRRGTIPYERPDELKPGEKIKTEEPTYVVDVLVRNDGNAPAAIRAAFLESAEIKPGTNLDAVLFSGDYWQVNTERHRNVPTGIIVRPSSAELLSFHFLTRPGIFVDQKQKDVQICSLVIDVIPFSGEPYSIRRDATRKIHSGVFTGPLNPIRLSDIPDFPPQK